MRTQLRGKVVETNSALKVHPELLTDQRADFEGFLVVLLVQENVMHALKERGCSSSQYEELLQQRRCSTEDSNGDVEMQITERSTLPQEPQRDV